MKSSHRSSHASNVKPTSKNENAPQSAGKIILPEETNVLLKGKRKGSNSTSQIEEILSVDPSQPLNTLNIHTAQQQFFNEDEHISLSQQMRKLASEESVHMDSIQQSASKHHHHSNNNTSKQKRGSVQQLKSQQTQPIIMQSQQVVQGESSLFSVLGPFSQKRNSLRKQPSEMLSMLSSIQNQNLIYKNDGFSSSSDQLPPQKKPSINVDSNYRNTNNNNTISLNNNNNNNNMLASQNLNSSFSNSNGPNSSFLASSAAPTNKDTNINNQIIQINNNNLISSNIGHLVSDNIHNSLSQAKHKSHLHQYQQHNLDSIVIPNSTKNNNNINNNNNPNGSFLPYVMNSFSNPNVLNISNNNNNKSMNIDQTNNLPQNKNSNFFSSHNHQQAAKRLSTAQTKPQNSEKSKTKLSVLVPSKLSPDNQEKAADLFGDSSLVVFKLPISMKDRWKILTNRIIKLLGDASYLHSSQDNNFIRKCQWFWNQLFDTIFSLLSLNIMKNKPIPQQRTYDISQMIFLLVSLVAHIFTVQFYILRIISVFRGHTNDDTDQTRLALLIGNILCFSSAEMHLIVNYRLFGEVDLNQIKIIYRIIDVGSVLALGLEVFISAADQTTSLTVLVILRVIILTKILWVFEAVKQLKLYFLKLCLGKSYEIMKLSLISLFIILIFTNSWCVLIEIDPEAHPISQSYHSTLGTHFTYFLQQSIANALSLHSSIEVDQSNIIQIVLLALQQLSLGLLFMYIFSRFLSFRKPSGQQHNSIQDLVRYCTDLSFPKDIIDETILTLINQSEKKPCSPWGLVTSIRLLPPLQSRKIEATLEDAIFSNIPFLNTFYSSLKAHMVNCLEEVVFLPDSLILQENCQDDCSLYLILRGEVDVFHQSTCSASRHCIKTLKRLEFFGDIAFMTGQPRKASVSAKGHLTLLKFKRQSLLSLISNNVVDYQAFCMIRDQILNSSNYSFLQLNCYLCGEHDHLSSACPLVHYHMDLVAYVNNYYGDTKDQQREPFVRQKRRQFKTLMLIKTLQKAVSGILDDTEVQGLLSEAYSSEINFEDNEMSRQINYDSALLSIEFSDQQNLERGEGGLTHMQSKKPSQIILPSTPDRRPSIRVPIKGGSFVAGEEEGDQVGLGFGDTVFSATQISNKAIIRSKTNPKDDKNFSPKPRTAVKPKQSVRGDSSIGGSRYSRSYFHQQTVTPTQMSRKEEIARDDLSEKAYDFDAYFPQNNVFQVIEAANRFIKPTEFISLSGKTLLHQKQPYSSRSSQRQSVSRKGSVQQALQASNTIASYRTPQQLHQRQSGIMLQPISIDQPSQFFSVPNYGQTINQYNHAQKEYNDRIQTRGTFVQPQSNFLSNFDQSVDDFSSF